MSKKEDKNKKLPSEIVKNTDSASLPENDSEQWRARSNDVEDLAAQGQEFVDDSGDYEDEDLESNRFRKSGREQFQKDQQEKQSQY